MILVAKNLQGLWHITVSFVVLRLHKNPPLLYNPKLQYLVSLFQNMRNKLHVVVQVCGGKRCWPDTMRPYFYFEGWVGLECSIVTLGSENRGT